LAEAIGGAKTTGMTRNTPKTILIFAALSSLVTLSACAGRGKVKADTAYIARDVNSLYNAAKSRLDGGNFKVAATLFDEVERQHPYSIWARRAQLMSAFSYHMAADYIESNNSAQRFISIHPGNRDAPYAYYLVALNYYAQISDVTRDQKITQQTLDAMGELMRRYPDSRYAADARLKVDLINDHLAGKEMEIGRFYQRRGQWLAASVRFRTVSEKYQTTTHTAEALMRLTESFLAMGIREEAQRAAAVLGRNYPASKWYERAFALMQKYPAS
jgi:outer membrane protein assembly factor BamD